MNHLADRRPSAPQLFSPGGSPSTDDPALLRSIGIVLGGVVGLGILLYLVRRYCCGRHDAAALATVRATLSTAAADLDRQLDTLSADAAFATLETVLDAYHAALPRPFPPPGVSGSPVIRVSHSH
jgi:hypothetical protein